MTQNDVPARDPAEQWLDGDEAQRSVLVVDDNMVMVKLMVQTLTPHGLRCHWAKTVEEAKQIFAVHPIDMLISDIRTGFLDGVGLARWARGRSECEDLPVVFFTSCNDRETIQAAASLGNVDYVLKPLRPLVFTERVLRRLELCR